MHSYNYNVSSKKIICRLQIFNYHENQKYLSKILQQQTQ